MNTIEQVKDHIKLLIEKSKNQLLRFERQGGSEEQVRYFDHKTYTLQSVLNDIERL